MHYKQNVPGLGAGHLPPVSANFGTVAAPGAGGWIAGSLLSGPEAPRALLVKCQTGAFGTITGCQFKLRVANDANGTGAADVTGGAFANITTANTEADSELSLLSPGAVTIDPTKFYAVVCAVAGSAGAALVAASLSALDAVHAS